MKNIKLFIFIFYFIFIFSILEKTCHAQKEYRSFHEVLLEKKIDLEKDCVLKSESDADFKINKENNQGTYPVCYVFASLGLAVDFCKRNMDEMEDESSREVVQTADWPFSIVQALRINNMQRGGHVAHSLYLMRKEAQLLKAQCEGDLPFSKLMEQKSYLDKEFSEKNLKDLSIDEILEKLKNALIEFGFPSVENLDLAQMRCRLSKDKLIFSDILMELTQTIQCKKESDLVKLPNFNIFFQGLYSFSVEQKVQFLSSLLSRKVPLSVYVNSFSGSHALILKGILEYECKGQKIYALNVFNSWGDKKTGLLFGNELLTLLTAASYLLPCKNSLSESQDSQQNDQDLHQCLPYILGTQSLITHLSKQENDVAIQFLDEQYPTLELLEEFIGEQGDFKNISQFNEVVIDYLAQRKMDLSKKLKDGYSFFHYVLTSGNWNLYNHLVQRYRFPGMFFMRAESLDLPIHLAIRGRNKNVVYDLLRREETFKGMIPQDTNLLTLALENKPLDSKILAMIVTEFEKRKELLTAVKDSNNLKALIKLGEYDLFNRLLKLGWKLDGFSPLHAALEGKQVKMFRFLLNEPFNINPNNAIDANKTILESIIENGDLKFYSELIQHSKEKLSYESSKFNRFKGSIFALISNSSKYTNPTKIEKIHMRSIVENTLNEVNGDSQLRSQLNVYIQSSMTSNNLFILGYLLDYFIENVGEDDPMMDELMKYAIINKKLEVLKLYRKKGINFNRLIENQKPSQYAKNWYADDDKKFRNQTQEILELEKKESAAIVRYLQNQEKSKGLKRSRSDEDMSEESDKDQDMLDEPVKKIKASE